MDSYYDGLTGSWLKHLELRPVEGSTDMFSGALPCPSPLPLYLSLIPGNHEVTIFVLPCPCHMSCHRTKSNGADITRYGLKSLRLQAKLHISSFKLCPSWICNSIRKLTKFPMNYSAKSFINAISFSSYRNPIQVTGEYHFTVVTTRFKEVRKYTYGHIG